MSNSTDDLSAATLLLGLEEVAVQRVELDDAGVRVVHVVTAGEAARGCRECGVVATRVKEVVVTRPRDLCVGGEPIYLVWHKRRWVCRESVCPLGSFTEQIPQVPARMRTTGRLRRSSGRAVADAGRTVAQAGRDHRLSWPVVHGEFKNYAAEVLPAEPEPASVIGIDETRRGKAVWVQNSETDKWELITDRWHVGFVDIAGDQGLLGQVEGRNSAAVVAWIMGRSEAWRQAVQYVAIDMCAIFRSAVRTALPRARIVVDHFHVVQLANNKLADLRRRLTWKTHNRRGRSGDPEYDNRRLLRSNAEDLTMEQIAEMERDLTAAGTYGKQILAGWRAKEKLRALLALARTGVVRSQISNRMFDFLSWCADRDYLPELKTLAETVQTWWSEIEAFILTKITNAKHEGLNRVIKLEARLAYGFRNPANQRLRSRCATTRASRSRALPA